MSDFLPFLVVGVVTGSVYALAAMGLVVTYTTSGVFNFAHGAVGMFATYIFYTLRVDVGLPTVLAAAVAVLVVAPLMGVLIDNVFLRRLDGTSTTTAVVGSLGLLVALQGFVVALYGGESRQVAALFPRSTYRLPGVNVGVDQTLVVVIALAAGMGLTYFLRRTHFGLKMRAVVDNRDLAELGGIRSGLVTTYSWMLGCSFAALAGILFAPFVSLDSVLLTLLVVQAFGAAIVGRLRNLTLANLGAYGLGIAAALSTKLVASTSSLAGLPAAVPFVALFAVLVVSPKGTFVEAARKPTGRRPDAGRGLNVRTSWTGLVALVVVAAALPVVLSGSRLLTASTTLGFVLLFASLSLLVGTSRQVSLCHAVFVALGATTLGHLTSAGVPYLLALLLAGLAVVPIAVVLAVPTIRLSGLFLALATLGFGILAQSLLFPSALSFGRTAVVSVPRPEMFASDAAFYYVMLAVVATGLVTIEVARSTRLGRLLRALADSSTAVECLGAHPLVTRAIIFCLSAFLGAVAGGLLGSLVQSVNPASFDTFQSLIWIAVLITAGSATLGGSVLASVLFVTVPSVITSTTFTEWQPVAFGVLAMLVAQLPNGLAGMIFRLPDPATLERRTGEHLGHRRAQERYVLTVLSRG